MTIARNIPSSLRGTLIRLGLSTLIPAAFIAAPFEASGSALPYSASIPQDAVLYLEIADFAGYKAAYPSQFIPGAIALQKLQMGAISEQLQGKQQEDFAKIVESLSTFTSLAERFNGQIAFAVELPEDLEQGEPTISLVADYAGTLEQLQSSLREVDPNLSPVAGETYRGFALQAQPISDSLTVTYALHEGLLVASNHAPAAKRAIDALHGQPLASSIKDSPVYQKALSHSKGYDGGLLLLQSGPKLENAFQALIAKGSPTPEKQAQVQRIVETLALKEFQGIFASYPRGAAALKSGVGGLLYGEKKGIFDLYRKPAGNLKLPSWTKADNYSSGVLQLNLGSLKDQIVALLATEQPQAAQSYQQMNGLAAMFVGATLDDLLGKILGDHLAYSMQMDTQLIEASMTGQQLAPEQIGMPFKGTFALEVKDPARLKSILQAQIQNVGGAIQAEDLEDGYFMAMPMTQQGVPPGTLLNLALTSDSLYLNIGQAGELRELLASASPGAFESPGFQAAYQGKETRAFTCLAFNYGSVFDAVRTGLMDRDLSALSPEDQSALHAYFDFIGQIMHRAFFVGHEAEGAYLFDLSVESRDN